MKTILITTALLLCACQKAATPQPQALSTDDILKCDRRSVLYDDREHQRKEEAAKPPVPMVEDLKPGDSGYVFGLWSDHGRVYANKLTNVYPHPFGTNTILIRRVTDGVLADCDSPEMWVILNEGVAVPISPEFFIPVVGHIDLKPKRD